MKYLVISLIASVLSFNALADCRPVIEKSLSTYKMRDGQVKQNMAVGGALMVILTGAGAAPVALVIGGLVASGSGIHYVEKSNLKGLLKAINEAYTFYETGEAGDKLLRLKRKINRRLDVKISTEELVEALMTANENETLCRAQNMNQFAKRFTVEMD